MFYSVESFLSYLIFLSLWLYTPIDTLLCIHLRPCLEKKQNTKWLSLRASEHNSMTIETGKYLHQTIISLVLPLIHYLRTILYNLHHGCSAKWLIQGEPIFLFQPRMNQHLKSLNPELSCSFNVTTQRYSNQRQWCGILKYIFKPESQLA